MKDYKGPKTYMEFSAWHANRLPFKGVRLGQAFYNDFGYQHEDSYYSTCSCEAFNSLTDGLSKEFPNFWSGLE